MSTLPTEAEREARFKVESVHHFHGHECMCGFVSPVSRQRTEHITEVLLEALAPHIAAREAQAAARELREAADELEACGPMLRDQYVRALRLYADEPWRLENARAERGAS